MDKNEFDIDFDFDKEFDFDPDTVLDDEAFEDIDLSEFSEAALGLTPEDTVNSTPFDGTLDLSSLDLGDGHQDHIDLDPEFFLKTGSGEEEADLLEEEEEDFLDEEESDFLDDDVPGFFTEKEKTPAYYEDSEASASVFEDTVMDEADEDQDLADLMDLSDEDDTEEEDKAAIPRRRTERQKPAFTIPRITMPKITTPHFLTKFYDLYFAPVLDKKPQQEEPLDPGNPRRRRRRKSKMQIFKETYLPAIIVCVCAVLILTFVIGSVSNAIDRRQAEKAREESASLAASESASQLELEYQSIMDQAEDLSVVYDYRTAIDLIDTFSGNIADYPEMVSLRSELVNLESSLVAHQDPSLIPNLSFHVLMVDAERALADTDDLAGNYNKNFVTINEFSKILQQLYDNGYVLVDFDSFTENNNDTMFPETIYLPEGKKPIMLTETMVNYFTYMVDSNEDGVADAGGDGFASRLVVENGKIKAEYVATDGTISVGDYDLVPILESFIAEHPDFSYRGARATLAVCGYDGIFGYRINTANISNIGQAFYDEQVAGAKEIVAKLRELGYTLASYTYDNVAYGNLSAAQITADLQNWTTQITPVIGEVDTLVFARTSNITDYSGNIFKVLYTSGFRYFVAHGTSVWGEVTGTYVRQNRLMVTGENMVWYSNQFAPYFDCNAVIDLTARGGSVPKSG